MREFGLDETSPPPRKKSPSAPGAQDAHQDGQDAGLPDAPGDQRPPARKAGRQRDPRSHRVDAQRHGHRGLKQAPDAATLLIAGSGTTTATEEEAERPPRRRAVDGGLEFGRTTDPVRMYMREMGTVELLTREGEIEIAKRIER